jgi:hypothetical protein
MSCGKGRGRSGPSEASEEWIRAREVQEDYHKFGSQAYQQPNWWPLSYYTEGWLICPPKVTGAATRFFHADRKQVYTFHGRKYTYIGLQEGPKPHWEPYPCSPKPRKGKGKGKKGNGDKEQEQVERRQEEDHEQQGDPHGRSSWFPPMEGPPVQK